VHDVETGNPNGNKKPDIETWPTLLRQWGIRSLALFDSAIPAT